ncbi:MAG: hypothetical protein ACP5MH_12080, partial [Thermoproteus sp.]
GRYLSFNGAPWVVHTREAVCPYYDQFKAYADGENIVMTYDKFFMEAASGRLPKFDVLVLDEIDAGWGQMYKKLALTSDLLRGLLRQLKEKGASGEDAVMEVLGEVLIAVEQGVVPSNLKELEQALRIAARRLELEMVVPALNSAKVIDKQKGKVVFLLDHSRLVNAVGAKAVVYLTGTPMSDDEAKELFRTERTVLNKRQMGRFVLLKGGEIKVKGIWFKDWRVYKEEVRTYCKKMDENIRKISSAVPTLVPIFSYRHFEACESVGQPIELYRQYLDKDGRLLQKFAGGEIPVVFSSRAIRGVHFNFGRMAVVLSKYPFPDLEDELVRYMMQYNRLRRQLEVVARSTLYQALGRGVTKDEDVVYVYSPDKRVYEEIGNMSKLFDMTVEEGNEIVLKTGG